MGTVPKYINRKIVDRGKIDTPSKHTHAVHFIGFGKALVVELN